MHTRESAAFMRRFYYILRGRIIVLQLQRSGDLVPASWELFCFNKAEDAYSFFANSFSGSTNLRYLIQSHFSKIENETPLKPLLKPLHTIRVSPCACTSFRRQRKADFYKAASDRIISGSTTFLPLSYCLCCSSLRPTNAAPEAELSDTTSRAIPGNSNKSVIR